MEGLSDADVMRIQDIARRVAQAKALNNPDLSDHLDDICQQVVIDVSKRIADGAEIDDLEAYVKQATRNKFAKVQRRIIKQRELDLAAAVRNEVAGDPDAVVDRCITSVSDRAVARRMRSSVNRNVRRVLASSGPLNIIERWVLAHKMDGLPAVAIAERVGLANAHTVDVVASRARRKLRRQLLGASSTPKRRAFR